MIHNIGGRYNGQESKGSSKSSVSLFFVNRKNRGALPQHHGGGRSHSKGNISVH